MNLVEEAIRQWETYREGVIAEIENIPEEQLDHRPGPGGRTIREIALHIATSGVGFTDELLKPDGALVNLFRPDVQARLQAEVTGRSCEELVATLRRTMQDGAARLRDAGEALASQTMPSRGGPQSRLTALYFAISHEMYHRGQLAIEQRAFGGVPALTRVFEAQSKK